MRVDSVSLHREHVVTCQHSSRHLGAVEFTQWVIVTAISVVLSCPKMLQSKPYVWMSVLLTKNCAMACFSSSENEESFSKITVTLSTITVLLPASVADTLMQRLKTMSKTANRIAVNFFIFLLPPYY